MDITEYFDQQATLRVKTVTPYTDGSTHNTYADLYACKDCGALVLEDDRNKHATQHDLRGILLERLGAMSHSHGVIA